MAAPARCCAFSVACRRAARRAEALLGAPVGLALVVLCVIVVASDAFLASVSASRVAVAIADVVFTFCDEFLCLFGSRRDGRSIIKLFF